MTNCSSKHYSALSILEDRISDIRVFTVLMYDGIKQQWRGIFFCSKTDQELPKVNTESQQPELLGTDVHGVTTSAEN